MSEQSKFEQEGREAYAARAPSSSNPYSADKMDEFNARLWWARGWFRAAEESAARKTEAFNRTYTANATRRGQYD